LRVLPRRRRGTEGRATTRAGAAPEKGQDMSTFVRFECGGEDRMGPDLGPFEFVQLTYCDLRVQSPEDDFDRTIAAYHDGWWVDGEDRRWSDVVIFDSVTPPPTSSAPDPSP
jgi:hypothetical protein